MRVKKYIFSVGIDVSKSTLDFVVMKGRIVISHNRIENSISEIVKLIVGYRHIEGFRIGNTLYGLENTGIYSNHVIAVLGKLKANFVVENPTHLKKSLGLTRGKTDKVDAERIANYVYNSRDKLRLWKPRRPVINELARLSALRNKLIILNVALKVPLKEDASFVKRGLVEKSSRLCSRSLVALEADIKDIDESIKATWSSDERLKHLMELMFSVPSIGEITALEILITTNEFKSISCPKKFACYSGVAPFPYNSGSAVYKKTRVSSIANKKMKSLLHTCAISARRNVPDIKEYYIRKTEVEGKPKMLVLNAIRYKLILRVFACVNGDRLYEKNYTTLVDSFEG